MKRGAPRRLATRENTQVVTVALPRPVHERLMICAVKTRRSAAAIVRDAVTEWLDRHGGKEETR